jgi:hydroxyacylglutathione hydrolase
MSNQLEIVLFPCLNDNYGFLIHDNGTGETVSIDTPEVDKIEAACSERAWNLTQIWNTHHHADHTGGNLDLKKKFDTKIYGPGIVKGRIPGLSHPLFGGETFRLGAHAVHVFSTPGHTVDHIIYYIPDARSAFVGDTLFALGCGRLFEGSKEDMYSSLKKISNFPNDTKLYCAHEYTLSNAEFALTG